ncbi:MAG: class I SAM-dependent methyltransferase [Rhodomicrobium sp.]
MQHSGMADHYIEKDHNYFSHARREVLPLLPQNFSRIFELGCGEGSTSRMIKSYYDVSFCAGLDIDERAISIARQYLDLALLDNIESTVLPDAVRDIDVILCLDVLEHLIDPWRVVRMLHERLSSKGVIIASIPNVRYFRVSLPLVFKGSWELADAGILDRTHLRFFVKRSAIDLMTSSGLHLQETQPLGLENGRKAHLINMLTGGVIEEFLAPQYLVKVAQSEDKSSRVARQ